jgi:hypothetical protein
MRFDEDEKTQSFGPVLRRISILAVIVTAVPVMLWSITAFMRTYVAQPVIPSARPLPPSAGTNTASASSADYAVPAPGGKPVIEARATATDADGKSDQLSDGAASAQVPGGTTASIGTASAVQMSTGSPSPQAANRPTANSLGYSANLPNSASGPWPDPSQAIGAQPSQTANSGADTSDALPPSAPLTGPIPLPPHRPKIIAMADGTIPLPRKRPAGADAAADPPPDDGNFFTHLFGSSH